MKRLVNNLKYIKIEDILALFIFIIVIGPSLIFKIINKVKRKKLILVTESGETARDNGYHLYKYIRTMHKDDFCFYVIDKNNNDYNKVKEFGNIIQYKSLKHWLFYLAADYNVSNQKSGNPNAAFFFVIHVILGLFNNRVFLQHGITKDNAKWLYYKNCKFKYFICGAKREYEYIKNNFGYPEGNVVYTGFARFDNLHDIDINQKQILIMPTWRNWLGRETNAFGEKYNFKESSYFKNWNGLLNDSRFTKYIENNNIKVLFYPHMNMQKFLKDFTVKSKNVEIVSMDTDIQKVLKESKIMITDYSSVYMDFAYMSKPVIYFHFDYKEYRNKQYQDGYFDYENDGFGPVCYSVNDLINSFININERGIDNKYILRMNNFFELKDRDNCKRIYSLLK